MGKKLVTYDASDPKTGRSYGGAVTGRTSDEVRRRIESAGWVVEDVLEWPEVER
jgi:hypothetical protein